ncbi:MULTISPECIES: hypothetical protein [unclassified Nocardioides]|uniref:hypothetical protein n=1 Tax=unclassified Nocardioides TaxID=2615069 RepID=UPI0006FA0027|nr:MULTISPECIES: hypothetical protein [unclassified Nocardioides]KRA37348.1 hypothetical protein ASD81_01015 [Nocardioides sp. Root614]KRA91309.1 hypothetical protein ASD84_01280 [Nocardioides sp. Root682]
MALALLLTACSNTDANDRNEHQQVAAAAPLWTDISIDDAANPDEPVWDVRAVLSSHDGLPALLAGSVANPGEPNRAVIWDRSSLKKGTPLPLDVDAAESWVGNLSVVGEDTFAVGWTWERGQQTSFVQRSRDRRSWEPIAVPEELVDQDVYLHTVVDNGAGAPVAIGSSLEQIVAVDLTTGDIRVLPSGEHLTSYDVGGAATLGSSVVVLVTARNESAGDVVVPYVSNDGGSTWAAAGKLPGVENSVSGVVVTASGLVATGAHLVGDARRAAAWASADGRTWVREKVPHQPTAGWSTDLGAPVVDDSGVYAAVADSNRLETAIVRRTVRGEWESFGPPADQWRYPGTSAVLARDGDSLLVARSEDGRLQVGRQTRTARGWRFRVSRTTTSVAPVSWWTSMRVDGETVQAVGGRTVMEVTGTDNDWYRSHKLAAYSVIDGTLRGATLTPRAATGLADLSAATAPDGTQVVVGERRVYSFDGPRLELVGWRKRPGATWEPVNGLAAPRVSYLNSVAYVGGRWVIAGRDAANTWLGHAYGALWTSRDGRTWKRERGPFDVDQRSDSWIKHVCSLPDGDLLAVGGVQDAKTSSRPVAFRLDGKKWTRLSLTGLGPDAVALESCATTGDVTLVKGWELTQQFWSTSDGTTFTRHDIGVAGDNVGEVVSVPGGFAAAGMAHDRSRSQPVVWLSANGTRWTQVPIPASRSMSPGEVALWGDRLVVTMASASGPGVYVLENLAELLSTPIA